ncbi:MAG: hypothetical protein ACJAR9_000865 [Celeribacter sp.]|jgi:hypothetical protein
MSQSTQERGFAMTLSSHIHELKKKHQNLADAVESAQRSPSTDDLQVVALKKQKLRLKEEISRLSA